MYITLKDYNAVIRGADARHRLTVQSAEELVKAKDAEIAQLREALANKNSAIAMESEGWKKAAEEWQKRFYEAEGQNKLLVETVKLQEHNRKAKKKAAKK